MITGTISELKKESAKADNTILATDEDREGESIAWHLKEALKLKNPQRIVSGAQRLCGR